MKSFKYFIASILLCVFLFNESCNEPSIIGSDLLDEELINVRFSDTSTLVMKTVPRDSILTFSPGNTLFGYMLGEINDPVFGYSKAEFYSEFTASFINDFTLERLGRSVVDSAVLVLAYEENNFYGDQGINHITVHKLTEDFDEVDTLYSNMSFEYDPMPIGEKSLVPTLDSFNIRLHGEIDSFIRVGPQIRIPLTKFFAGEITDTMFWQNDSVFSESFPGIHINSESSGEGLFGLNLSQSDASSELNRIVVYMRDDTIPFSVSFDLLGNRFPYFEHDYSGSIVEGFLNDQQKGDSLLFLQCMSGVDIELDIPNLRNIEGMLINKAEIELITAEIPADDTSKYSPVPNVIMTRDTEEANEVVIEDVRFALNAVNLEFLFGGFLEEDLMDGISIRKYTMNVTDEVLSILADENKSTQLRISPFVKSERPNRSVIFGPKHSTFPARLKITFTEP